MMFVFTMKVVKLLLYACWGVVYKYVGCNSYVYGGCL